MPWHKWFFVRKRTVEVQYLKAVITEKEQRNEFQTLVDDTIRGIGIEGCSCPIAAFAFHRIHVQRVPLSDFASANGNWLKARWCASRESILVCLTNLASRLLADAAEAQSTIVPKSCAEPD